MSFKKIKPEELQKNPFQMIGKEWLRAGKAREGSAKESACRGDQRDSPDA